MRGSPPKFAAVVSFFLLVGVIGLWRHSYHSCDLLVRQSKPDDRVTICSEFGLLVFEYEPPQRGVILAGWCYFDSPLPRRFRAREGILGFSVYQSPNRHFLLLPPTQLSGLTVPYWFVALAAIILPARWVAHRQRGLRYWREGRCRNCGYDMRFTPKRCPECGTDASFVVPLARRQPA